METGWVGGCGWAWRTERAVSWQVEGSLGTLELEALTLPLYTTQAKERLECPSPWLQPLQTSTAAARLSCLPKQMTPCLLGSA